MMRGGRSAIRKKKKIEKRRSVPTGEWVDAALLASFNPHVP